MRILALVSRWCNFGVSPACMFPCPLTPPSPRPRPALAPPSPRPHPALTPPSPYPSTIIDEILGTPWAYWSTFVVEDRHGFNKTTIGTFIKVSPTPRPALPTPPSTAQHHHPYVYSPTRPPPPTTHPHHHRHHQDKLISLALTFAIGGELMFRLRCVCLCVGKPVPTVLSNPSAPAPLPFPCSFPFRSHFHSTP